MAKLPWYPKWATDWLNCPELSLCGPATRGIWEDALCAMHLSSQKKDSEEGGVLTGTVEQLSRVCRASPDEMRAAIIELFETGTADVRYLSGDCPPSVRDLSAHFDIDPEPITLVSRRMARD